MRRRLSRAAAMLVLVAACSSRPPVDPLKLDGNRLTVSNLTSEDWMEVDIRMNTYYHFPVRAIPSGGRYQVGLDSFVAGYGQRFDFRRAQITDLRLTAKRPSGEAFELAKQFERGGLAGALEGLGGKH